MQQNNLFKEEEISMLEKNLLRKEQSETKCSTFNINIEVDNNDFLEYLSNFEQTLIKSDTEYLPTNDEEGDIVNSRTIYRVSLENDINLYLLYTTYDLKSENPVIADISLLYHTKHKEVVEKVIDKIISFKLNDEEVLVNENDEANSEYYDNLFILESDGGMKVVPLEIKKKDFSNIDTLYNERDIVKVDRLIKKFNKKQKSLTVMCGETGSGKTKLIEYVVSNTDKKVIYIPICFLDFIANPEFRGLVKKIKDSIFVIDNSEMLLSEFNTKNNFYAKNLLQIVDGLESNSYSTHILCIMDVKYSSDRNKSIYNVFDENIDLLYLEGKGSHATNREVEQPVKYTTVGF